MDKKGVLDLYSIPQKDWQLGLSYCVLFLNSFPIPNSIYLDFLAAGDKVYHPNLVLVNYNARDIYFDSYGVGFKADTKTTHLFKPEHLKDITAMFI